MYGSAILSTARVGRVTKNAVAEKGTSLGTVNLVAPIDRNFIDISAIIRLRLCTFELPIE
jgi:hypothetical protein